jgi:hypothetical protein
VNITLRTQDLEREVRSGNVGFMNSAMNNSFIKVTSILDGFDIQNNRPNEENICVKYNVYPIEVHNFV